MKHKARISRLGAILRRRRPVVDDRIPVHVVDADGRRVTEPHYCDGNGDYRHGLWQVKPDETEVTY